MLFQSHKLFAFQLSQIECAQLLTVVSTNHSFAHTSVTAQLLWTLLNSFHFVGLDSSLLIVLETDLLNFNSLFLIYLFFSTSWENLSTNWFGCVTSHLFILFNVAEWPNPVNFRALILLRLSCLCSFQVNDGGTRLCQGWCRLLPQVPWRDGGSACSVTDTHGPALGVPRLSMCPKPLHNFPSPLGNLPDLDPLKQLPVVPTGAGMCIRYSQCHGQAENPPRWGEL